MNNIKYKNIILDSYKSSNLPYSKEGYVKYGYNTSLSRNTLNNTFNQFIDNDKYIERRLNSIEEYQYGPKSDDSQKIYDGPNGYKFFKDENGTLTVYRKDDEDLNKGITKEFSGSVNFICQSNNLYFCGTSSGLKYSEDLKNWQTISLWNVAGYYQDDTYFLVAASDGVYVVDTNSDVPSVYRINKYEMVDCTSIAIDDNEYIYIGSKYGIYRGNIGLYTTEHQIEFEQIDIYKTEISGIKDANVVVNDILCTDKGTYISTSDAVYKGVSEVTLKGYRLRFKDEKVNFTLSATITISGVTHKHVLVGTNKNLYHYDTYSGEYTPLMQNGVEAYSGTFYDNHIYIGTSLGLAKWDLDDGEIPTIVGSSSVDSSLTNVKIIKTLKFSNVTRVVLVNGNDIWIMKSFKHYQKICSFSGITDVLKIKKDKGFYISTTNGLYFINISVVNDPNGQEIKGLQASSSYSSFTKGALKTGKNIFAYGTRRAINFKGSKKKTITLNPTDTQINCIYFDSLIRNWNNALLICTNKGLRVWDIENDKVETITSCTDNIQYIVKYNNFWYGIVKDGTKQKLKQYNQDFRQTQTNEICELENIDNLVVKDNNLYVHNLSSKEVKKFVITEENGTQTVEQDEDYNVTGITKLRSCDDKLIVAKANGLYDFSNGEVSEKPITSNGYNVYRETGWSIEDFHYTGKEYYIKNKGTWYYIPRDYGGIDKITGDEIRSVVMFSGGITYVITDAGMCRVLYTDSYKLVAGTRESYLTGSNIKELFGSGTIPYLVIEDSSSKKKEVYSFNKSTNNQIKKTYTVNIYNDENGIVVNQQSVSQFNSISFTEDGQNAIAFVSDDKPYLMLGSNDFKYVPVKIGNVKCFEISELYCISTDEGVYIFRGFGNTYYFKNISNFSNVVSYNKFAEKDDQIYLGGLHGVYQLKNDQVYKISASRYDLNVQMIFFDETSREFYIPVGDSVYKTDNIRLFRKKVFEISGVDTIKQIYRIDSKNYFFVTNNGLYKTNYGYNLVNDVEKFTIQDAINIYQSMTDQINEYYSKWYSNHISQYHGDKSNADLLNNYYINRDFEEISNTWQTQQHTSDFTAVENDLVYEILTATNDDGDIYASISNTNNSLSGLNIDEAKVTYILKRWKSGINELYIYIPTTNTYYLPFNKGVPNLQITDTDTVYEYGLVGVEGVSIPQRTQTTTIKDHYTNINLHILSDFCYIEQVQDIQINGNSLPLHIFKDRDNIVDKTSKNLYQSFIEPSVVERYDISQVDEDGYYSFKFRCFGTDAQAIRIQFYDPQHKYGNNLYTIEFNSNGGSGKMRKQRVPLDSQVKLKKNKFTKRVNGDGRVFMGWSLTKQNDIENYNNKPKFLDESQFSAELAGMTIEKGDTITLYAVWFKYNFGNGNSTQIVLDSNEKEFIVKEAQTFKDDKIGDQVIIDYGE